MPTPLLRAFMLAGLILSLATSAVRAQVTPVAILSAEDRRAQTPEDLATIRAGLQSANVQIARIAVRAMGRLERPTLIADILPSLSHSSAEIRAEAATAIGQAAQGWKRNPPEGWTTALDAAQSALIARLKTEPDPHVRVALADTLGRLPYSQASQAETAERAILEGAGGASVTDHLALAQGLFRLTRLNRTVHPLGTAARAKLVELVAFDPESTTLRASPASRGPAGANSGGAGQNSAAQRGARASKTDAGAGGQNSAAHEEAVRVRRLALEGVLLLGPTERVVVEAALRDGDPQVRRLAVRGAAGLVQHDGGALLTAAVADAVPMVRIEAVRGLVAGQAEQACALALKATGDAFTQVALTALDELSKCGGSTGAVEALAQATADVSRTSAPRQWHRAAHALTSLAIVAPERAAVLLRQFTGSSIWQLRLYAVRAAATLKNREALDKLAQDEDDNVREEAIDALAKLYGHDADAIFVAQLTRTGNQVLRSAATALAGTPHPDLAIAPLQSTLQRLIAAGLDNSHDAREAISKTLVSLGQPAESAATAAAGAKTAKTAPNLDPAALRRLASARARVTMRGVGVFELTLLTAQAPASVLRFARLAEAGFYNGLTFHRIVPNFVIQGGSPGANEYIGDATFMRDEVGLLPQLRGAVGVSTRGRDTGDAQIYVDLVDNPRLDHDFTVFAEVSRGIDVVDRVLEGDVIERIDIIP
jgi:cyclophilin family peptidyl-prolyl cis-trans isomerase/HEAT repeat protein